MVVSYQCLWLANHNLLFLLNPFVPFLCIISFHSSPSGFMSYFFSTLFFTTASFFRILVLFYSIVMHFLVNLLCMFRKDLGLNPFFCSSPSLSLLPSCSGDP